MAEISDRFWQAICESDAGFDSIFLYGVKTTGVYCKPSCKSRNPLRKNAISFSNTNDAESAGFRACLRCKPA
ncbi:MAG: hypothetical protein JJ858_04480 [Rhizobiaceae bacterium]|nr:hypothetical protein [Rhizobiaceae bacterium]